MRGIAREPFPVVKAGPLVAELEDLSTSLAIGHLCCPWVSNQASSSVVRQCFRFHNFLSRFGNVSIVPVLWSGAAPTLIKGKGGEGVEIA